MRLLGFDLTQTEPMTMELVPANLQKVAEPQAGGVRHQNPRAHELAMRALHATSELRGYRKQSANVRVTPRHRVGRQPLDTPQGADYTPVHQSKLGGKIQKPLEHATVVVHSGGRQMREGVCKVGVDLVGAKGLGGPRQSPDQHLHLLQVAGGSPDAVNVRSGQFDECHGEGAREGVSPYKRDSRNSTARQNRYNRNFGQLAQLVSCPFFWAANRRWPILRFCWLSALGFCVIAGKCADGIMLVLLGHFTISLRDLLRALGGRKDS